METGLKLATEQALGFLLAVLVVSVIQPDGGGAIFLFLVCIAIYNVIVQFAKLFWSWTREDTVEKKLKAKPNGKSGKSRRRRSS
jgi:hypothetical protein